jgi:prepilin-type processing-associated H-X9-DG protein
MKTSPVSTSPGRCDNPDSAAFTLLDLLTVIAVLVVLTVLILPALARTQPDSRAFQCRNNLSQMSRAWRMYADDNNDLLLAAESVSTSQKRVVWLSGYVDFNGSNPSNWDVNQDLAKSPIQPYLGKNVYTSWRCPADQSAVSVGGKKLPRVRSISMSQVFGNGSWLPSPTYRVYAKGAEIVNPAKTWVFMDEHPDSINDGSFASQMAAVGSVSAQIIDFPASYHDGACGLSFADGHSENHKWIGLKIKPPVMHTGLLALNVSAGDSVPDVIWLSGVTTVRN